MDTLAQLLTAVTWIGAGLLVLAGLIKLRVPDGAMAGLHSLRLPSGRIAARVLGLAEIAVGLTAVLLGGQVAAALLGGTYVVMTAVAARQRANQVDCGCFGVKTYPVSRLHIGLNAVIAVVALGGLAAPLWSVGEVLGDSGPAGGVAATVLIATAVGLLTTMTEQAGQREASSLVATR